MSDSEMFDDEEDYDLEYSEALGLTKYDLKRYMSYVCN